MWFQVYGFKTKLCFTQVVLARLEIVFQKKCSVFSVASRRKLETAFLDGGLVYVAQYQQKFIDLKYFTHF